MNLVLDIFYKEVIKEASKGEIDSYLIYNVIFATTIENKLITNVVKPELFVPTLLIKNKAAFDKLLITYTNLAYEFYKDKFPEDISEHDKIKSILALLWSNATSEDFKNPIMYLQKRISFFNLDNLDIEADSSLGKLKINLIKDELCNETPYYLEIKANDNMLPKVSLGIFEDTGYIYAIQNKEKNRDKTLNRQMYKVNVGINLDLEESDNIMFPENLKGVTPSTLISATIALAYLKNLGVSKIAIPVFLPVRWNSKELSFPKKYQYMQKRGQANPNYLKEAMAHHEEIQRNLSDKFIRTFRRLDYHFSNIEINALPFIHAEDMLMTIDDDVDCNNPLLLELYQIVRQKNYRK